MASVVQSLSSVSTYIRDTNPTLHRQLMLLRGMPFKPGHRVALALSIAQTLMLPASVVDDFNTWFITQKQSVMSTLDKLSEFVYIDNKDEIVTNVRNFTQWRYSVFYEPTSVLVMRGENCVVDEITGIDKFVDPATLCKLADVYSSLNHYCMMFRNLARLK